MPMQARKGPAQARPAKRVPSPLEADSVPSAGRMLEQIPCPVPPAEEAALVQALGRVAAEDVRAPFSVPGFTRSRFDGYALRAEDISWASPETPVPVLVEGFVPAGSVPGDPVFPHGSHRIMTGAPLPKGADCVVPFEEVLPGDRRIAVTVSHPAGFGVGRADCDVLRNRRVICQGWRLAPIHLARAAMIGLTSIPVFRRPRVAILSTGSELVEPGSPRPFPKLYNSTQFAIAGHVQEAGAEPVLLGAVPDDAGAIAERVLRGIEENAMLVTTGGVGQGDCDCMREALLKAGGTPVVEGCAFRPGGNFQAWNCQGKLCLCLSGGPGSALIALGLFGIPFVRRLTGQSDWQLKTMRVGLASLPERQGTGLCPGRIGLVHGKPLFEPFRLRGMEQEPANAVMELKGKPLRERDLHGRIRHPVWLIGPVP